MGGLAKYLLSRSWEIRKLIFPACLLTYTWRSKAEATNQGSDTNVWRKFTALKVLLYTHKLTVIWTEVNVTILERKLYEPIPGKMRNFSKLEKINAYNWFT